MWFYNRPRRLTHSVPRLRACPDRQPRASEWARKLGLGEEQLEDLVDRGTRARLLLLKSFTPMVHLLVRKHSSGLSSSDKADLVGEGRSEATRTFSLA